MNTTFQNAGIGPDRIGRYAVYDIKTAPARSAFMQGVMSDDLDLKPGQYRFDQETQRYVRLIRPRYPSEDNLSEDDPYMPWLVEDVLTEQRYFRSEESLWDNPPVPPMVVTAWAAQDHPDINIAGE